MSTPTWPLDEEVAAIKESIASIQQSAGQAETNSSVAALEAAIDQKAIQYLDRALADIQAKETAWKDETRSAQLANALQQRTRVVNQVIKVALVEDLDDKWVTRRLFEKTGITEAKVNALLKAGEPQESSTTESSASPAPQGAATSPRDLRSEFERARITLEDADLNYTRKARDAEEAWSALLNAPRTLLNQLARCQQANQAAKSLVGGLSKPPANNTSNDPKVPEAILACREFLAARKALDEESSMEGDTAWKDKCGPARDALAHLLVSQIGFAKARRSYERQQAAGPGASFSERAKALVDISTMLAEATKPVPAPAQPAPAPPNP